MNLENTLAVKKELITFEQDIADLYKEAKIKAPVHLAGGNEEQLISIFRKIKEEDWVCTSYRSHYQALLKGIPSQWIREKILQGESMFLMSEKYKFLSSAIVPGQLPIALGIAQALKLQKSKDTVWAFCGDMAAETGIFHEVVKYASGHELPINFIVEDDGLSVYTPTKEVWMDSIFSRQKQEGLIQKFSSSKAYENEVSGRITRYEYKRKWAHHGIGLWVDFLGKVNQIEKKKNYREEVKNAMNTLAEDERVVFIGQTVGCKGSAIYDTLSNVSIDKRIELPIMEEVQMGMATGMALAGYIPVAIYPRFDFLTLATNQLVNHLDKINIMSHGDFNPTVIIRTMVGSKHPLYPGPQHCQDHTDAYKLMAPNINFTKLTSAEKVVPSYIEALHRKGSSMLIEIADLYN